MLYATSKNDLAMSRQNDLTTLVQSTIDFTHNESKKRITYNGAIHAANTLINSLYPGHTDKVGSTGIADSLKDLADKGDYAIVDIATGKVEHMQVTVRQKDLADSF